MYHIKIVSSTLVSIKIFENKMHLNVFPTRRSAILVTHYGQFYAWKVLEIIKSQDTLILIESEEKSRVKMFKYFALLNFSKSFKHQLKEHAKCN